MTQIPATRSDMTRDDLEQLPDRELDAIVSEILMGIEARIPKRCMHTGAIHHEDTVIRGDLPFYSMAWEGFGRVVERMRELGFGTSFGSFTPVSWDVSFTKDYWTSRVLHESLPRAAALAAILAVQAVEL